MTEQNQIQFHVVAFTDRGRHFLHLREDECELLREMGQIYQGIKSGRAQSPEQEEALREKEILKTQRAISHNIGANVLSSLREPLRDLYKRAKNTFAQQKPQEDFLEYAFSETIENYCPTAIPPTPEQLKNWLPSELAQQLGQTQLKSMQDAHAKLIQAVWQQKEIELYVLSGTPGIGKTTALRDILANYSSGYLLIYLSPRIQVNLDLMAKFDPTNEENLLIGKEELIGINTNSVLIKAADYYHGKAALNCYAQKMPDDPKFLFLSPDKAEELESQPLDDSAAKSKRQSPYQRTETGAASEVSRHQHHGVFKTICQAIYRLNTQHDYKRIVACVATQANRQLDRKTTTIGRHLRTIFGDSQTLDTASVEQFAKNIKELVFFIDEVTGDGAGRQTVHDIINFRHKIVDIFEDEKKVCPLTFRIIIADASLINVASVESYLNETQSQPDQIVFHGDADCKGLSIEDTKIMRLPTKVINANVYPASSLILKWRPILGFSALLNGRNGVVATAYRELETGLLKKLAAELVSRWQQKPKEQLIVIIQNKKSVEELHNQITVYLNQCKDEGPKVLCLHAYSTPQQKREIVSPASVAEKLLKSREVPISQKGDLYDIIIMTSSGTRGISFPNASKIICLIPTFSLERNFMEFLQGMYRGRGSGKGNQLDREIELIIPQILVAPSECTTAIKAKQISNLLATLMLMRMSIFTRLFGACDLFGQSISCIPIAGQLVKGAAQTTMDQISSAIEGLKRAQRQHPSDTNLRYVTDNIEQVFKNETVIFQHDAKQAMTLAAAEWRNQLVVQFTQDANRGLHILAQENYLPEGCYTVGELILQQLDSLNTDIKERNKHLFETHIEETHQLIKAICVKLKFIIEDKKNPKAIRDQANVLYPIFNVLAGGELDSDTESEMLGTVLNRWLVFPINALHIPQFWQNQVDPHQFKHAMKELMINYLKTYLCQPSLVLPIFCNYDDTLPPWLLMRGSEIEQQLHAQFQTRYFISSKSLALLNIMLLSKHANQV